MKIRITTKAKNAVLFLHNSEFRKTDLVLDSYDQPSLVLSDELYNRVRNQRLKGETFSATLVRIIKKNIRHKISIDHF
jgi:hypothetical protein